MIWALVIFYVGARYIRHGINTYIWMRVKLQCPEQVLGPHTIHTSVPYLCSIPPFHTFVPYPRSIPLLVHVGLLRAMLVPCWAYVGLFGGFSGAAWRSLDGNNNSQPKSRKLFGWEIIFGHFEGCVAPPETFWNLILGSPEAAREGTEFFRTGGSPAVVFLGGMLGHLEPMLGHRVHVEPMLGSWGPCWVHVEPMLSLCWAKNGVFLLEAKRNTPFWGHVGAMLGPCWAYVGPCWAYVGPMLGQERRVHLGPSTLFLGHVGAMLGPKTMVFATFGIKKHGIYSVFAYHHAKTLVFNGIYAFFRLLQQGSSLSLSLLPSLSLSLPLPRPYSLSFSFLSLLLPSTSSPPPPLPRYDVELAVNKVFLEKSYKVPGVCVCVYPPPLLPSLSGPLSLSLFLSVSFFGFADPSWPRLKSGRRSTYPTRLPVFIRSKSGGSLQHWFRRSPWFWAHVGGGGELPGNPHSFHTCGTPRNVPYPILTRIHINKHAYLDIFKGAWFSNTSEPLLPTCIPESLQRHSGFEEPTGPTAVLGEKVETTSSAGCLVRLHCFTVSSVGLWSAIKWAQMQWIWSHCLDS